MQKMTDRGYALTLDDAGRLLFAVRAPGASAELTSSAPINDGKWHHVIAEADRAAQTLIIYIDGRLDSTGPGIGKRLGRQ